MAEEAVPKFWSKEMTLALIHLYKGYECLWDRYSLHYRNRQVKTKALMNIAAQLDIDCEEVIRKLHNLRCQLNSEIRKVVRKRNEGLNYSSAWELFDTLLFISEVKIPEVRPGAPSVDTPLKIAENPVQKSYQVSVLKKEALDDLIEIKYEADDNHALYPFVQLETQSSPEETITLHAAPESATTVPCLEPPLKRLRENYPDDEQPVLPIDDVTCLKPDVFVDNPMVDDAEDDARAFGDFVAAELSRIRSEERRKLLKETIEQAVKAMVDEDEKEFFQDPITDPLC